MQYQKNDLSQFPKQIRYAMQHYQAHGLNANSFDNIILSGLGGSGIAGRIAKSYFYNSSPFPIEVISDYELPYYAGKRTLAIMSSYSGNTEETLSMYEQAKTKGCTIVVITTGGRLAQLAQEDGYTIYKAEAGFQPRMALGYSLTYLLLFFGELFNKDLSGEIEAAAKKLDNFESYLQDGKELFNKFSNLLPRKIAVVTDYLTAPVGLRFCQQVQENAKAECFLHELPESNHNVIESYYGSMDSVFLFLNSNSNKRTGLRFSFLKDLLQKNGNTVLEMNIDGKSLASFLENIFILDWVSLWIADNKGVNSAQIPNINALKEFLSAN